MPIQFPDMMGVPSPEEHSPFLNQLTKAIQLVVGYPRQIQQQDIVNALKNVELQYAPQTAEATLLGKQLENQKLQTLLPYLEPEVQAKILEMQLSAQKHQYIQAIVADILKRRNILPGGGPAPSPEQRDINILGGRGSTTIPPSSTQTMSPNEQQAFFNQLAQRTEGTASPVQGATIPTNLPIGQRPQMQQHVQQNLPVQQGAEYTYPEISLLSQYAGFHEPKIEEIPGTGQKVALSAFGTIPVIQGLNAQQAALQAGLGTGTAKAYGDSVASSQGMRRQGMALDMMINALDNPNFYSVTGPIASRWQKVFGTKEQKDLLGTITTASGEVMLQIAPSIKGAWTGRDQAMVNLIKAGPTDNPYVFIGKLKAQKIIGDALIDREERAQSYMAQGMLEGDAYKKATAETPLSRYEKTVNDLINPKEAKIGIGRQTATPPSSSQDIVSSLKGKTEEQKRKIIGTMSIQQMEDALGAK